MTSDWENLPQHLLQLIAESIPVKDFVAFNQVCSSWRSAALTSAYVPRIKLPWLMLAEPRRMGWHAFFSLSQLRICELPCRRGDEGGTILSSRGWVLPVGESYPEIMLNPLAVAPRNVTFSDWAVKLPDFRKLPNFGPHLSPSQMIHQFVLSSSPTSNRDFLVMIIYGTNRGLAFCSPDDKEWTVVNGWIYEFYDVIHYRGQLVGLTVTNLIFTSDVAGPNRAKVRLFRAAPIYARLSDYRYHLVESAGSLLLVMGGLNNRTGTPEFKVYAIDLEAGKCVQISRLGGAAIFVDSNSSFSMQIDGEHWDPDKIKPNCIYYAYQHHNPMGRSTGIYHMTDGEVFESFSIQCRNSPGVWIEPCSTALDRPSIRSHFDRT